MNFTHDGFLRAITINDLVPGTVIRSIDTIFANSSGGQIISSAFSDNIIISYSADGIVTLVRPYASSLDGIVAPRLENYQVSMQSLLNPNRFQVVLLASGKTYKVF